MIEQLRLALDPNQEDPGNDGADSRPSLDLRPASTIIMDAGIASGENIQWLRDQGCKYIVVSRKRHMEFDEARCVAVKERENVTVRAVRVEREDGEVDLYSIDNSWDKISATMSTQVRITTSLRGEGGEQIHVRKSCRPSADQQILLRALGQQWLQIYHKPTG